MSAIAETPRIAVHSADPATRSIIREAITLLGAATCEDRSSTTPPCDVLVVEAADDNTDEIARAACAVGISVVVIAPPPLLERALALPQECELVESPLRAATLARRLGATIERRVLGLGRDQKCAALSRAERLARLGTIDLDVTTGAIDASPEARRVLGLDAERIVLDITAIRERVRPDQREPFDAWLAAIMAGTSERSTELRIVRSDQHERIVRFHAERSIEPRSGALVVSAVVHDVTDRRRVEDELDYVASHDDLTGLANRRRLLRGIESALADAQEARTEAVVLFLDLDRFKDINDSLGRAAGDRLLIAVAERLRECVRHDDHRGQGGWRDGDLLARAGGDEFAIVIRRLGSREAATAVSQRMLAKMRQPFAIAGREIWLTGCIGISRFPADGVLPIEILKQAEMAMYHAKELGRSSCAFFDIEMNRAATRRLELEADLRRAIERDEFEVFYQSRTQLRSGRIAGFEALARWRHPQRGLVGPDDFVPVAEETGLIVPIGSAILRKACRQAAEWHAAGFRDLSVAVNLSTVQFDDDGLARTIASALADSGLDPSALEFELTESTLARNVEQAIATLTRIKQAGPRLAVDDFGTGYSSFAYLKQFPIDILKIDKCFVDHVSTNRRDAAITSAIIVMAHNLGLQVVAEGIEQIDQAELLRQQGCDQGQGYYFSHPVPAADAGRLLAKQFATPLSG